MILLIMIEDEHEEYSTHHKKVTVNRETIMLTNG